MSDECEARSAEFGMMKDISSDSGSKTPVEFRVLGAEGGVMEDISSDNGSKTSAEFRARGAEGGIMEDILSDSGTGTPVEFGVRNAECGMMEEMSSDGGDVTSDDSPAYSSQGKVALDVSSDCWITVAEEDKASVTGFITTAILLPDCDIGRSEEYGTMLLFPVSARTSKVENISSIPSLFTEFTGPVGGSAGV